MENETFTDRIERLLKEQGKKKADFSKEIGTGKQNFYDWKKRGNTPTADIAVKIARYLNTSVEYLVTGKETNEYKKMYEDLLEQIEFILEMARQGRLDEVLEERKSKES